MHSLNEQGVLDRFTQIKPKVLFSVNAVVYNGKVHDHWAKLKEVVAGLPTLERVVVIPFVESAPMTDMVAPLYTSYQQFTATTAELHFEQLPFDHPLFILYSSGTTGLPKCIVHCVGVCFSSKPFLF